MNLLLTIATFVFGCGIASLCWVIAWARHLQEHVERLTGENQQLKEIASRRQLPDQYKAALEDALAILNDTVFQSEPTDHLIEALLKREVVDHYRGTRVGDAIEILLDINSRRRYDMDRPNRKQNLD